MSEIELDQVGKTYPGLARPALSDVSLRAPAGELLAVLGPSGSGKSTLLKIIAGIESADAGTVRLGGQDVGPVPAHRRGAVLMFQRAHLFPYLSVAANVAFGLRVRGVPKRVARSRAEELLALVGLAGTGRRRPTQLSGGEQQRVALARALVTEPRVLLLDEPLSSLDAAVRVTLQEAVRRIQRELGVTTVLVTHDRSEAMAMADRVAIVDDGRLLTEGTPQQVFERPPTRRAAELVGIEAFLSAEALDAGPQCSPTVLPDQAVDRRPAAAPKSPDGKATVYAIRPEHIQLTCTAGPGTLAGKVIERTYRGEYTEVSVETRAGRLRARTRTAPELGTNVHVLLPRHHLVPVDDH